MQAKGRAPLTGADPVENDAAESAALAGPPARRLGLFASVAVVVVVLDQVSKLLVVAHLADRPPVKLLGGFLTLTYTRNPGAAFSMGTGFTLIFTAVAVAVTVVIVRTARRLYSIGWAVALGALLGGAVGNLVDRLLRSPGPGRGHVVDWIQLPHFAVFNLADSAITCSAVGMVLLTVLGREMDGRHRKPGSAGAGQAPDG